MQTYICFLKPKKMIRFTITILLFFLLPLSSFSQKEWTLEECIDYAYKNNLSIKTSQNNLEQSNLNLKESKYGRLPNLNANGATNNNIGRTIDPFTNQFTTSNIFNANIGVSAGVTLFSGFTRENTIKDNQYRFYSSGFDLKKMQDDIGLAISNAFLQIIFNQELVKVAINQVNSTSEQLKQTEALFKSGRIAENALLEIEAQLANDELALINAQNSLKLSYVNLWQLMDMEVKEENKIKIPVIDSVTALDVISPDQIYSAFILRSPALKSAEALVKSAEYRLKTAKGSAYPTLSARYNLSSVYSESFRTPTGFNLLGTQLLYFDQNNNPVTAPFLIPSGFETNSFSKQIGDNFGQSFGLSLQIPIFNGLQVKSNIQRSRIQLEASYLNVQTIKNTVYKDVVTAFNEYIAARSKYESSYKSYKAQEKAFAFTKARFDQGLMSYADFSIQNTNRIRAEINFINAKYEYLFRTKVIDFYTKGKIELN